MKTLFKMEGLEVNGVKLGNIVVEQEYTAKEAIEMVAYGKQFMNEIVDEMPKLFTSLKKGFDTFEKIDHEECMQQKKERVMNQLDKDYILNKIATCDDLKTLREITEAYATMYNFESSEIEFELSFKRQNMLDRLRESKATPVRGQIAVACDSNLR